jgi:hypothetical protein
MPVAPEPRQRSPTRASCLGRAALTVARIRSRSARLVAQLCDRSAFDQQHHVSAYRRFVEVVDGSAMQRITTSGPKDGRTQPSAGP